MAIILRLLIVWYSPIVLLKITDICGVCTTCQILFKAHPWMVTLASHNYVMHSIMHVIMSCIFYFFFFFKMKGQKPREGDLVACIESAFLLP